MNRSFFMSELNHIITSDGSSTLFSSTYNATYHSRHGAITESLHVFIQNGLSYVGDSKKQIKIFEIGFGTGLNALLSLNYSIEKNIHLIYESIDTVILSKELINDINYFSELKSTRDIYNSLHECLWNSFTEIHPNFILKKHLKDWINFIPDNTFDLFYLDAFAPEIQPELWSPDSILKMYQMLNAGGVLVTYCAKGQFKRTLKEIGFVVEALQGPPGKREITRAIKL